MPRRSARLAGLNQHGGAAADSLQATCFLENLSDDQLEYVLRALAPEDLIPASCASKEMQTKVRRVCSSASFLDALWSAHWETWHSARGTRACAIDFMMSLDESRIPLAIGFMGDESIDPARLATVEETVEWDASQRRPRRKVNNDTHYLKYRAEREWPRLTADGGAAACMAALSQPDQRYRTLAACHLRFDEKRVDKDAALASEDEDVWTHPAFHKPMTGDLFSCELIMKQFGDGSGRVRGWPRRSLHYDVEKRDGTNVPVGYEGSVYADCATRLQQAGQEIFLIVNGELHDDDACYAPQPNLARVRLVDPGQAFTAARLCDNEHVGSAKVTTWVGDIELCFNGPFGQVCHIMRRVPDKKPCPDPLEGECGCVMTDSGSDGNPAGEWWEDPDEPLHATGKYYRKWFTRLNMDGDCLDDSDDESDSD